jgi:transcription initiation factor IIF auxiliary subunit
VIRERIAMSLTVQQGYQYEGNDRWSWWIALEGPPAELDQVESVTYVLHPTFHEPIRTVKDRASGFRLEAEGWGTFTVRLSIHHKSGKMEKRRHELVLKYPDDHSRPVAR